MPCAPGTYKELAGNEDCAECPEGFTTANATGLTSRRDCNRELGAGAGNAACSLRSAPCSPFFSAAAHHIFLFSHQGTDTATTQTSS